MAGPKQRLAELRARRPGIDHVLRMQEHYGRTKAGQQAGAVTYFAFLSFFPILALALFVVGLISHLYPAANANLLTAIDQVLPGIINQPGQSEPNRISLDDVRSFSGLAGVVGVLGVLYSGLGWVSALRSALEAVFETPEREQPGFVPGKLRDLRALVAIGVVLVLAVAVAGFVSGFSGDILDWIGLGTQLGWVVKILAVVLGLAANAVMFFVMFRLLAEPHVPRHSLWQGAWLGSVLFEVLKQISQLLIQSTAGQPAFQAFGIALILVVWINYFSRVVLYSASFACTTVAARALQEVDAAEPVQGPVTPSLVELPQIAGAGGAEAESRPAWVAPFAAGGATALALVALLRGRSRN